MRLSAGATDERLAAWTAKLNRPWYDPIVRVGEERKFVKVPFEPTPAENFEFDPATGLISAYTGTDIDVVVPREIDGVTVVGFDGWNVFASCQDYTNTETASNQTNWVHLRTLVLPETIRELPDGLLSYCQQLETFLCYAPVESTGKSTFVLCRSLKNTAFLNGVHVIDSYAFDSTGSLENLWFGEHVQKIASNAFNFSGLTTFTVDADEIETGAFSACENLTSLHFTRKVKTIGETFAMECPNLAELCFECDLANTSSLLLLTAAPQLTVHIPADADEETRRLVQNCMSWSENPSEITVTCDPCAHTLPARPDAAALAPHLALDGTVETGAQTPEQPANPAPVEAPAPAAEIPAEFLGTWYGVTMSMDGEDYPLADMGLQIAITFHDDGTVDLDMNGERDTAVCTVQDGALSVDGASAVLEGGRLLYSEGGSTLALSREQPEAAVPAEAPVDETATLADFCGIWTAVSVSSDGMTLPAEAAGMGGDTLTISGDHCDMTLSGMPLDGLPCRMDGCTLLLAFLDSDCALTLRADGTLAFAMDDAVVRYERTGDAPEDGGAAEAPVEISAAPAEAPVEAPSAPAAVPAIDPAAITERRYVMTDADMQGFNMTAAMFGGMEYSFVLHDDGTMNFVLSGTALPTLRWALGKVPVEGGETDGVAIDYYGQPLNLVPTEAGFDLNYFDTMLIHFAPEASAR